MISQSARRCSRLAVSDHELPQEKEWEDFSVLDLENRLEAPVLLTPSRSPLDTTTTKPTTYVLVVFPMTLPRGIDCCYYLPSLAKDNELKVRK
jgi:hypothetical protein